MDPLLPFRHLFRHLIHHLCLLLEWKAMDLPRFMDILLRRIQYLLIPQVQDRLMHHRRHQSISTAPHLILIKRTTVRMCNIQLLATAAAMQETRTSTLFHRITRLPMDLTVRVVAVLLLLIISIHQRRL